MQVIQYVQMILYAGPVYGKMFLKIVDAYSKWISSFSQQQPLKTSRVWYKLLPLMACLNRLCQTIDRVSQVMSFAHFSAKMQFSSSGGAISSFSQSNGQADRVVQSFKAAIQKAERSPESEKYHNFSSPIA